MPFTLGVGKRRYWTPLLTYVTTIALEPSGNMRDPSSAVQDPKTKKWHFVRRQHIAATLL